MANDASSLDFLGRVRRALDAVADEIGRLAPERATPGLLDGAAHTLTASLDRWSRHPMLSRFVGGVRRDVVTSAGEPVELSASLPLTIRDAVTTRFVVGETMTVEVPAEGLREVRAVRSAPAPGLYPVHVEHLDAGGRVLSRSGVRILQVVDGRPVAMVHAELLLQPSGPIAQELRALADEAFELVYFDLHEKNREGLIVEAIERLGVPEGAVVVYSAAEQELVSLGLDFVRMFVTSGIRQLRAKGVPVTTVLTRRRASDEDARSSRVGVATPAEALARARSVGTETERAQAAELAEERARTPRLDWLLDQLTETRRVDGNQFVAELDNRSARETIFEAIEQATESVHLQFYMIRPGDFLEELVVRLVRRARDGVRVRFMIDALYSEDEILGRSNPVLQSLRDEPGVEVLALGPIESPKDVSVSSLKRRDHRKLLIVDGARAFVSGRNAGDEYYKSFAEVPVHDQTPHERVPWLDAHVELRGPLVAEVQLSFAATWREHGGGSIDADAVPEPVNDGAAGRFVVHHGFADTHGLALYEALFDAAEHHAYIVNDFPFVPALERAIRRALARGVVVKVLTGNASARRDDGTMLPAPVHRTLFEYMVKARLEPLMEAGVEVYEFRAPPSPMVVARGGRVRPYVHAKVVSVDGVATSIGSANLDGTAAYWENEANVVVQDSQFAGALEAELERMMADGYRIDLQSAYWKSERAQRAVVSKLWPGSLYS